jgi:uracil-DNA glycosylase family 4
LSVSSKIGRRSRIRPEPGEPTLQELNEKIVRCKLCPRLVSYLRSVSERKPPRYRDWEYWANPLPGFGDPSARLLVIGLAPAAHGGNRTGRMFTGDRSGDWLFKALHEFGFANQPISTHRGDGLKLRDCYVTAAVRCAPPDNRPLPSELQNCHRYLIREFHIIDNVTVIIALGQIAFHASLRALETVGIPIPSPRPKFGHGASYRLGKFTLLASYHSSQQNTLTGRLTEPMFHSVFRKARKILLKGSKE